MFLKLADWLEPKKEEKEEVPRKHKLYVRKIIQPHIEKRIEMGSIADPFGSCLSVVDNLTVAIEIMMTRFKISDPQKRRIDKIQKNLNLSKRKFIIMISDKYAAQTYGKDLNDDEELVIIYNVFDELADNDWNDRRDRDIYLEEWALDIRKELDSSFKELVEIANIEDLPVRPILYNSMSPDVKVKKVDLPPPSKNPPKPHSEDGDDEDRNEGEDDEDDDSGYPGDIMD